jgi:hypothetical protein
MNTLKQRMTYDDQEAYNNLWQLFYYFNESNKETESKSIKKMIDDLVFRYAKRFKVAEKVTDCDGVEYTVTSRTKSKVWLTNLKTTEVRKYQISFLYDDEIIKLTPNSIFSFIEA